MNILDVARLYSEIENLGIAIWLDGGWGIDALLAEQTRPHADMDIVVQHKDVPKVRAFLQAQGYRDVPRDDTSAWNFVLGASEGRLVDVHAVKLDAEGNGLYGPSEKGVMYPAASLTGIGALNGQTVRCISAEYVIKFRTQYRPRPVDLQDVAAICERFQIDYPTEYVAALNNALVEQLKASGFISTTRVEAAFRAVPRHLFVPGMPMDKVYRDEVIVTKQSASGEATSSCEQPAVVAVMLEQLDPQSGQRVLEIGAGSGHVAALLAHLVGPSGEVTTIDIQPDLVVSARRHLAAAGFPQVRVISGDGGFGDLAGAPYDRIILTVGSSDIAPAWRDQLRVGGRLVLPLYLLPGIQQSVAFEKREDCLESLSMKPCGFLPLQGAFMAERPHEVKLASEPGLTFALDHGGNVDAQSIFGLLSGPSEDLPTGLSVTPREVFGGLGPWLALRDQNGCGLSARGEWVDRGLVPCLVGMSGQFCSTGGLVEGSEELALYSRPPETPLGCDFRPDEPPFPLYVKSYGPDHVLAERLVRQTKAWADSGRPTLDRARITAYPPDHSYSPEEGEYLITRPSVQLVLKWPA